MKPITWIFCLLGIALAGCAASEAIQEFFKDPVAVEEGAEKTASLLSLIFGTPGALAGLGLTTLAGFFKAKSEKGTARAVIGSIQKAKQSLTTDQKELLHAELRKLIPEKYQVKIDKIKAKL